MFPIEGEHRTSWTREIAHLQCVICLRAKHLGSRDIALQRVVMKPPIKGAVATGSTEQFFRRAFTIDAKALAKTAFLSLMCLIFVGTAVAQELTPRLYWPSPTGTKVLVTGYSYTSGDILFDRSIPLNDVDSELNVGILAYLQTVDLWGRSGNFLLELPYIWGNTSGFINDTPARADFSNFGDIKITTTINLLGAPSMTIQDFLDFRANPRPIIGASLKLVAPTGDYDSDKLINVGANRWATRAQIGTIYPLTPTWLLELEAGVWFYGDDDEFLPCGWRIHTFSMISNSCQLLLSGTNITLGRHERSLSPTSPATHHPGQAD